MGKIFFGSKIVLQELWRLFMIYTVCLSFMSPYSMFMINLPYVPFPPSVSVLTFDQALNDSWHFNTTLDDRDL